MKSFADTRDSSSITHYEYDHDALVLEVEFKNGVTYQYFDVDEGTFELLQEAKSVGNFIATKITTKFKFEKLPGCGINKPRPWRFPKADDFADAEAAKQWPFPVDKPSEGPAHPAILDEEVFTDQLEWTQEEEEEFLRMVTNKNEDL